MQAGETDVVSRTQSTANLLPATAIAQPIAQKGSRANGGGRSGASLSTWRAQLAIPRTHSTVSLLPVAASAPPTAAKQGRAYGGGSGSSFIDRRPRLVGALAVGMAAFSFASANLATTAVAAAGMPTSTILFWIGFVRAILGGIAVTAKAKWRGSALCRGERCSFVALLGVRQLAGCSSSVFMVGALTLMPVGEATCLMLTAPIWTAILARVFLKEALGACDLIAAVVACIGVTLVGLPADGEDDSDARGAGTRLLGALSALLCALSIAFLYVAIRAIGPRQEAIVGTTHYGVCLVLTSLPLVLASGASLVPAGIPPEMWLEMICGCSISLFANVLINWGLQKLEAGLATVIATLEIAFAFVFQVALLGIKPPPTACVGAALVLACTLGTTAHKLLGGKRNVKGGAVMGPSVMGGAVALGEQQSDEDSSTRLEAATPAKSSGLELAHTASTDVSSSSSAGSLRLAGLDDFENVTAGAGDGADGHPSTVTTGMPDVEHGGMQLFGRVPIDDSCAGKKETST